MPSEPRNFTSKYAYHIYNCGAGKSDLFDTAKDYEKFLQITAYYRFLRPVRLSHFLELSAENQLSILKTFPETSKNERIKIFAYCLMPNHYHILIRPKMEYHPSNFMADVSNSYTKYYNRKNDHLGRIFQGPFKSKVLHGDASVLNVARYIHLNPVVSKKTNPGRSKSLLAKYPYSSYRSWKAGKGDRIVNFSELRRWVSKSSNQGTSVLANPSLERINQGIESLVIEKTTD